MWKMYAYSSVDILARRENAAPVLLLRRSRHVDALLRPMILSILFVSSSKVLRLASSEI